MKLKYLIPALAPMLLAACTVDEEVLLDGTNGKIAFTSDIENGSRASQIATTANLTEFMVTAINTSTPNNFFSNVRVKKSNNVWWTVGGDYYWSNYALSFYSYATNRGYDPVYGSDGKTVMFDKFWPVPTEAEKTGLTQGTTPTVKLDKNARTFTNVWAPISKGKQYDFLVAVNNNVPAPTANGYKVPVHFEHAFAAVIIKVKGTNPANHYNIVQTRIGGLYNHGTLTVPATTTASGTSVLKNAWKTTGEKVDYFSGNLTLSFDGGVKETVNSKTVDKTYSGFDTEWTEIFVIPQKTEPWDYNSTIPVVSERSTKSYIGFRMSIHQKSSPTDTDFSTIVWPQTSDPTKLPTANDVAWLYAPLDITFEPNKKYVIVADITGGGHNGSGDDKVFKINFDVTVTDLGTGTEKTITF